MPEISLRPVEDGDESFILQLFSAVRAGNFAALPPAHAGPLIKMQFEGQRREYRMRYPEAQHSIVMDGEERIGRLWIDRGAEVIRVVDISLLPARSGTGIGGALLARILEEARQSGHRVRLMVARTNRARRLYVRLGFAVIPEEGDAMYEAMEWRAPDRPLVG